MSGRRGSVLAYVLLLALLGCLICTGLTQMRLQPAVATANAAERVKDDLAESAALNRLTQAWARLGSCASDPAAELVCRRDRPVTPCGCVCETSGATIRSVDRGGACALAVSR